MVNRFVLPICIDFLLLLCCVQIQRGLTDQTVMTSSYIKQQLSETVAPPYCTAYTILNEHIVKKLLTVETESNKATVSTFVNQLLCAAKNVHNQLHEATKATEQLCNTIDEQITQLDLSVSHHEKQVRQSQEAIHQANVSIQHVQHQITFAEAAVRDSENSLHAANSAVYQAEEAVRQARICGMGRRRKRFLGSLLRELNPVRIFRNVIGKPLCSVINSGGIDNAKDRRALAQHNLHQAHQRLHTHQQNLANQRAHYHTVQAQHHDGSIKLQTIISALNEQRAKYSMVTSLAKQLKDIEVHLNDVLGSSAVLQNATVDLIDFDLVIEPLNNIYREMLTNNITKSFGFEISAKTAHQIKATLKKLTTILPEISLDDMLNADTGEDHVCNLSTAYQQCSGSMTINHHLQDLYNVTLQSNSSSTESNLVKYPIKNPYVPSGSTECPPLSNTYTVYIQSFSYNTDSKEFQDGAERAKSKFYTCLHDPPVTKPSYASFMSITKAIHIDNQYTAEQIKQCNHVPECIQRLWITYYFVKAK